MPDQEREDKLKEAAEKYASQMTIKPSAEYGDCVNDFIRGANWQKNYHTKQEKTLFNESLEHSIRNILSLHLNNFYDQYGLSIPCKVRTKKEDEIIECIKNHIEQNQLNKG